LKALIVNESHLIKPGFVTCGKTTPAILGLPLREVENTTNSCRTFSSSFTHHTDIVNK
jgi:hypothetical protein